MVYMFGVEFGLNLWVGFRPVWRFLGFCFDLLSSGVFVCIEADGYLVCFYLLYCQHWTATLDTLEQYSSLPAL